MTAVGGMWLVRRLVASVAIIVAVVTFVFILIHAAPGKPCAGQPGEAADPVVCEQLIRQFALD
ncbi:MAG: ABC transporter permease, partial [Gemmatimonadetes bacterium]